MIRIKKHIAFLSALLLFCLCSCAGSDEEAVEEQPQQTLVVNLSVLTENQNQSRAWGDPGEPGLQNELPRYLYLFMVVERGINDYVVEKYAGNGACVGEWTPVKAADATLYKYSPITISLNTAKMGPNSKVYAIASYQELPDVANAKVTTKDKLEQLQFSIADQGEIFNLFHIYASAMNDEKNGKILSFGSESRATVICNHIVGCVDVQWNVAKDKMKKYAMREIKLTNLPTEGYYFKPTDPVLNESNTGEIVFRQFNPGNQWYGRMAFYTIDRNQVHCTYTLGDPNVNYPTTSDGALPDKGADPNQTTVARIYGPQGNIQNPTAGKFQNAYANWYRINVKFGYAP